MASKVYEKARKAAAKAAGTPVKPPEMETAADRAPAGTAKARLLPDTRRIEAEGRRQQAYDEAYDESKAMSALLGNRRRNKKRR